jgi:hypothetical protein
VNQYAKLLIWQYLGKPRASATIELLDEQFSRTMNGALSIPDMLDIDKALGNNLDIIGKIVGVSRIVPDAIPRDYFGFYQIAAKTNGYRVNGSGGSPWYRYGEPLESSARLTNSEMRICIRARIIKNFSDCSLDSLEMALEQLFGTNGYVVDILGPWNWQITTTNADEFVLFAAQNMDLLPRSAAMNYTWIEG